MQKFFGYMLYTFIGCSFWINTPRSFTQAQLKALPVLKLPLTFRCDKFSTTQAGDSRGIYYGKIISEKKTIVLTNQIDGNPPLLFVVKNNGQVSDSLLLFEKPCYCVTQIQCHRPWLKISKNLEVTITDTIYETKGGVDSSLSTKDNPHYYIDYIPRANQYKYKVTQGGKIVKNK